MLFILFYTFIVMIRPSLKVMHLSMSTPSPARTGTGSEISGDLKLFDAECTLGPGQFEYIRAFDMKLLHFMQQYCQIPVPLRY